MLLVHNGIVTDYTAILKHRKGKDCLISVIALRCCQFPEMILTRSRNRKIYLSPFITDTGKNTFPVLIHDFNLRTWQFVCRCYVHFRDYHFCLIVVFHSCVSLYGSVFSYRELMQHLV